jgi:hypothetical protein
MTDTELEFKLRAAKHRLSKAAARCLENDEGAAIEADAALAEVAALQATMKASKGRQCAEPGCSRFTLRDRCDLHRPRPRDIWQESRRIMDEIEKGAR